MAITLYYIRGISAIDTPYFSTLARQNAFFNNHIVSSIENEDYWYPPYLNNKIKFSEDDIDINTQVNYLSIDYNNKKYYYFISDMTLFPNGIVVLDVTLDTIQTYRFDIIFNSYLLTRKSIPRWLNDGAKINRNYIRENLSEGIFDVHSYLEDSPGLMWCVIRASDRLGLIAGEHDHFSIDWRVPTIITDSDTDSITCDGSFLYLLPYNINYSEYYWIRYNGYSLPADDLVDIYNLLAKDDRIISMQLVYDIGLDGMEIISEPNSTTVVVNNNYGLVVVEYGRPNEGSYEASSIPLIRIFSPTKINAPGTHNLTTDASILFGRNTNRNVPFSSRYVPAMIDSNYMIIEYGERMQTTTAPLELYSDGSCTIYTQSKTDLFTGFRTYEMLFNNTSKDPYQTRITLSTIEGLTLYNDPWTSWVQSNMGTVNETWVLQHCENVYSAIMGQLPITNNTTTASRSASLSYSNMNLNLSGGRTTGQAVSVTKAGGKIGFAKALTETAMGEFNIITSHRALRENLQGTPPKIASAGAVTADLMSKSLTKIYTTYYVKDFETVALLIEKLGYKVNEYKNGLNLFDAERFREYYNVIEVGSVSFDLTLLTTNEIKEDIYDRLVSGIRLWNVELNPNRIIGDYTYDNVEIQN